MRRAGPVLLLALSSCQVAPSTLSPIQAEGGPAQRWILVERPYDEVEYWIQDPGDAELAPGQTTLVFEPIEVEGGERLRLVLQASRCRHRLRCTSDVPDRRQVGDPVEVILSMDCDPRDVHRVEVMPTRPGVRIIGFEGAMSELPNLSGFHVRGSAKVAVRFTADSGGVGGIKTILSEVPR